METSDPPDQKPLQISLYRNINGDANQKKRGKERKKEEEANNKKRREMECKVTFTLGQLTGSGE